MGSAKYMHTCGLLTCYAVSVFSLQTYVKARYYVVGQAWQGACIYWHALRHTDIHWGTLAYSGAYIKSVQGTNVWVWITTSVDPPTMATPLVLLMPPSHYVVWQVWDGVCHMPHTPSTLSQGQDTSPPYTRGGEVRLLPNPITYIVLYISELLSKLYRIQDSATLFLKCLRAWFLNVHWTE